MEQGGITGSLMIAWLGTGVEAHLLPHCRMRGQRSSWKVRRPAICCQLLHDSLCGN